jgi:hypothetical protein
VDVEVARQFFADDPGENTGEWLKGYGMEFEGQNSIIAIRRLSSATVEF